MRLNQKPLFAGLFLAGLSISLFASAALGDTPPPVKAVSRAVSFGVDEAANTRKLIELAAEGWEYVGQLGNGMVAFKRPVPVATAAALTKLQGVWVLTSREEAGQGVEYPDDTVTMTFTGNRWVFKSGDEVRQAGTFTVDAGKDPKHFDFTVTEGGNLGRTGYAIFQFDGKRFRYCANDSGADARPTDFTTKEGDGRYCMNWKQGPPSYSAKATVTARGAVNQESPIPRCQNKEYDPARPSPEQQAAARAAGVPVQKTIDLGGGVKLEMVLIPAGDFLMGSPDSNKDALDSEQIPEKPQHRVRITKPFYLGKYLVTQEQWQAVMGKNPSRFRGPKNPVERVSWDDCQEFLEKLNTGFAKGKGGFALPTEAQWEYACRAGSKTRFCFGDDESGLGEYAWYGDNSGSTTHPVGEKKPNAWGLYDMHGNVWEWCADWYEVDYYAKSPADDPPGPAKGFDRVVRGGDWGRFGRRCRSAARLEFGATVHGDGMGVRIAFVPADK